MQGTIHVVQSLAGHADISITALYTAVWDEDKRAAVQRLRLRFARNTSRAPRTGYGRRMSTPAFKMVALWVADHAPAQVRVHNSLC